MKRYNDLLHEAYQKRDENPLAWSLVEVVDASIARCLRLERALGAMAHTMDLAAQEARELLEEGDE